MESILHRGPRTLQVVVVGEAEVAVVLHSNLVEHDGGDDDDAGVWATAVVAGRWGKNSKGSRAIHRRSLTLSRLW